MIRKLFLFVIAAIISQMAAAQGVLQVTDLTNPNDVYPNDDNNGVVVVKCNKSIPLSFESSMDKTADPYNIESEGNDCVYYIEFPTGNKYRGRVLSIIAAGYTKVDVELDVKPRGAITLLVVDPHSMVDAGCYRGHRNKGMDEIKKMNYDEAKNHFMLASMCSDCDTLENNVNLALVDSLIILREEADKAYKILDYREAVRLYEHIVELNPYDTFAGNRYNITMNKYAQECQSLFNQAEFYYKEKYFDKADELYQRVIDYKCMNEGQAMIKHQQIQRSITMKQNHSRLFTYEYMKDAPIGISTGSYHSKRTGGFFALNFNKKVFEMMRNNCKMPDMPEASVSFGWTRKIVSPVWVFFGPGFTTKFYYGNYKPLEGERTVWPGTDGNPNGTLDGEVDDKKVNVGWAISPVVGLCVKYSYFAIRFSYQYRFAMESNLKDFIGKQRFTIGVGLAY